jgi:hypothetical protein
MGLGPTVSASIARLARRRLGLGVCAGAIVVLALTLLVVSLAFATSPTFSDVAATHPYYDAVTDLASRGIITGFEDGTFRPNASVTRQQFAKMIVKTLGYTVTGSEVCPFTDVATQIGADPFYPSKYVAECASHGITLGKTATTFAPGDGITHQQLITMVARAAGLSDPPAGYTPSFTAAQFSLNDHYLNARKAAYAGLLDRLQGVDSTYNFLAPSTRGECAQLLYNLIVLLAPTTTSSCTTTTTEPPSLLTSIADLKGKGWQGYIGKTVTVEGIFVADPLPMLVTSLDLMRRDAAMSQADFILLGGKDAVPIDATKYGGALLQVTGEVTTESPAGFGSESSQAVTLRTATYVFVEQTSSWVACLADFKITFHPEWISNRYAILFSGGIDPCFSYTRYWNNLKFMYSALVGPLAFNPANVIVLYSDGNGRDQSMPVNYSATEDNLRAAFNWVRERSNSKSLIFVFTTNHGSGFHNVAYDGGPFDAGGHWDVNGDEVGETLDENVFYRDLNGDGDLTDVVAWDEALCQWVGARSTASHDILDDDLSAMFAGLSFDRMVVLMNQCFSGGLIHDITQGGKQMIMSACLENEFAYGRWDYSDFSYNFICAIKGEDPNGVAVDADANRDGVVSVLEAYNYARSQDTEPETSMYEDSGDGIPHTGAMPSGGEGTLGSTYSLTP